MMMPIISLLQSIAQTPHKLRQIIDNSPPHILPIRRSEDDEWQHANILIHLSHSESKFLARFQRMLAEEKPQLKPFTAADEPPHDTTQELSELLTRFTQRRQQTGHYLRTLSPDAWAREAYHPDYGHASLHFHVQNMFTHDREHLNQMQKIADHMAQLATTPIYPL